MSDNQTAGISAKELENIESKKLGELQVIAKSIGIKRVTGVRKKDLIDQIKNKAGQTALPLDGDSKKAPESEKSSQKEDEMKSYGNHSHIVSYKKEKEEEEKPDDKKNRNNKNRNNNRKNQNNNRNKRNHEHDQLPVSDKPTLQERLDEIIPQLGPYLVNEGTLEILPGRLRISSLGKLQLQSLAGRYLCVAISDKTFSITTR